MVKVAMYHKSLFTLLFGLFVIAAHSSLPGDGECKNSPPFEEWVDFHTVIGAYLNLSPENGLVANEDLKGRTILFSHSGELLLGFAPINIKEVETKRNKVETLAFQLLKELHNLESTFWKPFICKLLTTFPLFDEKSVNTVEKLPAIFWEDRSELKGTYLLDRIIAEEKYFKKELLQIAREETQLDITYYDLVWAYSIAESFGITIFDGVKQQFVLSPVGSLLQFRPNSMTHFAFDEKSNTLRVWSDDPYSQGSKISFHSKEVTTNDFVKFFGYFVPDNIFDRVYLDVFLDGNDPDYDLKEKFLISKNIIGKTYPYDELHYIDNGGLLSREVLALMRIKHFHLSPGSTYQDLDNLDPFSQISMENELHALKEFVSDFSSRIERGYSSDAVQDLRLFERKSTLDQPQLRNALAVRIIEKKLLVNANRALVHNIQRITDELSNTHKRKQAKIPKSQECIAQST